MESSSTHTSKWPLIVATLAPVLLLLPFAEKAYQVDDTLSLWVAEQIQHSPANFYGFDINWYGTATPAYEIIKNPPGLFYLLAPFFAIFGWGEIPVHLLMTAIAALTAAGTFLLARRLCATPLLATLIACLSPVFLLSSNTVMTDIPMVACYVWAIELWMRGLDNSKTLPFVLSGLVIGIGILMKYFCITAIPLLIAYTLVRKRRFDPSLYFLLIPVFIVGLYVIYGMVAYNINLLTSAADYALTYEREREGNSRLERGLIGLIFTGGCIVPLVLFAPLLWRGRSLAIASLVAISIFAFIGTRETLAQYSLSRSGTFDWSLAVHAAIFLCGGLNLLALTTTDLAKRRDAESLLLFCWIAGTLVFSSMLNWTVNGRTLLPLTIPAGILIARRIGEVREWSPTARNWACGIPLALAVAISLAVLWGDFRWGNTQRNAAQAFAKQSADYDQTYYYKGHWGFQWYMYDHGIPAYDSIGLKLHFGDRIVMPTNNYTPGPFNFDVALPVKGLEWVVPETWGVSTMHRDAGAGFYTHFWGPVPYTLGRVPGETYWVYELGDYRPSL